MTEEEIKKNLGYGKDLRGIKFNKLTPLYPLKERKKRFIVWHCQCDCGNECDVIGSHLTSGHTKSCGCYQKEKATLLGQNKIKDLSNQKFGNLTVIKRNGTYVAPNGNTSPIYLCKCDCGNECNVTAISLRSGHTTSCGCLKSRGENKISNILSNAKITFEREKTFNTCKFPDSNALARFDFYLPDYNICIEYDGEQHFRYHYGKTWNNENNFKKTQEHDQYKNNWCKENNITLIRIPYTHYEDIILKDLLNNSDFIKEI